MKKVLITIGVLAGICNVSFAQLTPEGVMANLPDMPTTSQMLNTSGEEYTQMFREFHSKLRAAQKQCQEMVDSRNASLAHDVKSKAMNEKVPGTNVTAAQARNMSKEELQAMAKSAAMGRVSSMGISSADLQGVRNGTKSKEDLASSILAQRTGGLTMKDIEAMSNMSDEEKVEFMMNSGLAGSTQAAVSGRSDASLAAVSQKIASLQGRISDLTIKSRQIREEADASCKELYARDYKSRIDKLEKEHSDLLAKYPAGGETTPAEDALAAVLAPQIKARWEQMESLKKEFYSKSIPLWRNAVIASMDVFRVEVLPLQYELKEAYAEAYRLTGSPAYMGGDQFPYIAASLYLEAAAYIDQYDF